MPRCFTADTPCPCSTPTPKHQVHAHECSHAACPCKNFKCMLVQHAHAGMPCSFSAAPRTGGSAQDTACSNPGTRVCMRAETLGATACKIAASMHTYWQQRCACMDQQSHLPRPSHVPATSPALALHPHPPTKRGCCCCCCCWLHCLCQQLPRQLPGSPVRQRW